MENPGDLPQIGIQKIIMQLYEKYKNRNSSQRSPFIILDEVLYDTDETFKALRRLPICEHNGS